MKLVFYNLKQLLGVIMKKLLCFVLLPPLMYSCTLNYTEISPENLSKSTGKNGTKVLCKPQREILVKGKCIKRRGFM